MAQRIDIHDRIDQSAAGPGQGTLQVLGTPSGMRIRQHGDYTYKVEDAREICDDFSRMVSARHLLPHGMRRGASRVLAHFSDRIRKEVLLGPARDLFDDVFKDLPRDVEIVVSGSPVLVNLPWETLRLKDGRGLAFHNVEVTRVVESAEHVAASGAPSPTSTLRLLVVAAEPGGLPPVDAHLTRLQLEKRLWDLMAIRRIKCTDLSSKATEDTLGLLANALHKERFDILLLLAHGERGRSRIALTDESGKCVWTDLDTLIPHLRAAGHLPRLVILASCHLSQVDTRGAREGLAPRLIEGGVSAVLGFQGAVSTVAAARSAAETLRWVVRGEPIGKAVQKARIALRLESIESAQPVLWREDKLPRDQPLFAMAPPDWDDLFKQAADMMGHPDSQNRRKVEKAHAAFVCGQDRVASHRDLENVAEFYRDRYRLLLKTERYRACNELQELQAGPSPEAQQAHAEHLAEQLAKVVFEWETRIPDQDRALLDEARHAVDWPLRQAIQRGVKCEGLGNSKGAEAEYDAAASSQCTNEYVERIRARARRRARRRRDYVRALRLLDQAEKNAEAGGPQAGAHCRDGLRALRVLWKLHQEDPGDFPAIDRTWVAQKRMAFRCLEACAEAELANERGERDEAVKALHRVRSFCRALTQVNGVAADRFRRRASSLRRVVRSIRRLGKIADDVSELAQQRRWAEAGACALQGAAEDPAGNPRLIALRTELDHLARRCLTIATADEALARVEAGVNVDPIGTASTRLAEAMRAGPLGGEAVQQARAGLGLRERDNRSGPHDPDGVKATLAKQLGRDAPMLLACWGPGDWDAAHDAWFKLNGPGDFDLARDWAVLALRRAEDEGSREAWGRALAAWSLLLGPLMRFWDDWLRDDQGEGLPRPQRLREELAHQLVCRLRGRPDAAGCLLAAERSPELYQHPEAFHELVFLALQLAEQALDANEMDQAAGLWKAALSLASAASTAGYGERIVQRIWSAIEERLDLDRPDADMHLFERGERLLRLVMDELLSGPSYGEASEALANCLVARGLLRLRMSHLPDVLEAAYDDFQAAHNEQPEPACEAARILTLVLLARAAEGDQRQRPLDQARQVMREARDRWPVDQLLDAADSLIGTETGLEDPRYEDFLEKLQDAKRRLPDGPSANLATRARIALDQGDPNNAVIFLCDALPESDAHRRPDGGESLPDLGLVHRILDAFIAHLTSPSQLALRGDQIALGREAIRRALILFEGDEKLRDHDDLLRASEAVLNPDQAFQEGDPP